MRALTLIAFAGLAAYATAGSITKPVAQSQYNHMSKAMLLKDVKTLESFLAPSYVLIRDNGKTATRSQVVQSFGQMNKVMAISSWTRQVTSVHGSEVSVKSTVKATIKDQKGKPHLFALEGASTDTWVENKGHWQMVKSVVSKQNTTLDGKPVHMQ